MKKVPLTNVVILIRRENSFFTLVGAWGARAGSGENSGGEGNGGEGRGKKGKGESEGNRELTGRGTGRGRKGREWAKQGAMQWDGVGCGRQEVASVPRGRSNNYSSLSFISGAALRGAQPPDFQT